MKRKTTVALVSARLTEEDKRRLDAITEQTGLSVSGVVQALIRAAAVQPVTSWRPTLGGGSQ